MPKETKNITLFNAGLITNPDINDIPDNAFSNGTINIKTNAQGKIQPAKGVTAISAITGFNKRIDNHGWIQRQDGKYDLVYDDGTNIKVIQDFYGTPSVSTVSSTKDLVASMSKNEGLHMGVGNTYYSTFPLWTGWIRHNQFNDANAGTPLFYTYEDGVAVTSGSGTSAVISISKSAETGSSGTFNGSYDVAVSYELDGYIETPLSYITTSGAPLTFSGSNVESFTGTFIFQNYASANRRITKIHVWMRPTQNGLFRLHKEIEINDASWAVVATTNMQIAVSIEDNAGESYEAYTGISQEVYSFQSFYKLSAELNGHMFTANATSAYHPNNAFMLFRSKENNYSSFDTATEFLKLPEIPNAIISHNGKLFAFSSNNIYRVNFNLFIEDVTEGIGCVNNKAVVSTEYGLFWADSKGIYQLSNGIEEISAPIRDLITNATTNVSVITYDAKNKQILVTFANNGIDYNTNTLAFNVIDRTWCKYNVATTASIYHMFSDYNGSVYMSYQDDLTDIYTSKLFVGSDLTYTVYSKEFDMEDPSQSKRFYKLIVDYSGSAPTVSYSINGGSSYVVISPASTGVYEIKSGGDWINAKTIMFKFSGTATINSYSVIFRRFIGRTHV